MSTRKRPLGELPPSRVYDAATINVTPKRGHQAFQSNTSAKRRSVDGVLRNGRPGSARNILRRLARVTATTTQRRVTTPTSTTNDKENIAPFGNDEDEKDDLRKPVSGFNIEESIEEEDSDLPVAPTPSALLEASDEEDLEQPTATFLDITQARSALSRKEQIPLLEQSFVYSDPALPAVEGEDYHESTFLSERGRRAVSEDRTRMSRYSFGSIRMSDFGSELEIRRESDRQQKLAELEAEDNYSAETMRGVQAAGETEFLKGLEVVSTSAPKDTSGVDEEAEDVSFGSVFDIGEGLQSYEADNGVSETNPTAEEDTQKGHVEHINLGIDATNDLTLQSDVVVFEKSDHVASQARDMHEQPQQANIILELDDQIAADETIRSRHEIANSRRQTLLESMIVTAAEKKPKKRTKLNERGNMVPGLPSSLMKRIIHSSQEKANKRKTAFGKDHVKALEQATEWFFQQASQDLEVYSSHSRRKKRIDTDDVLLLMQRQRVLRGGRELQKMARDWLPKDILNELDLSD